MYDVTNSVDSGRVIAFWSPVHRQGAVSTTTAMMACFMAEKIAEAKEDDKVLILSNELYGAPTAANYMVKDMMPDGLTEVVELSSSDNLKTHTDIYNNTFSGIPRIDILNSSKRNTNIEDYISREIPNIFNIARSGYKYTLVDTVASTWDESTMSILRNCDTIVVCMPQDRYILDSWIRKMPNVFINDADKKPTVIISEKHYEFEHMKYAQMKRELKRELYYLSLNDIVHKAVCEQNIPDMIKTNIKAKNPDDVILELEAIYDKIVENLDNIVQLEVQRAIEEEEESKQKTKEYLETVNDLFGEDIYGYSEEEDTADESGVPDDESIKAFMESESSEDNILSTDEESLTDESNEDDNMASIFGLGIDGDDIEEVDKVSSSNNE